MTPNVNKKLFIPLWRHIVSEHTGESSTVVTVTDLKSQSVIN